MTQEITSKNMDGITDLVVIAPIRDGFIEAYENVTYATRLKLVAEALNRVRVSAREHERITPFSDVTERILTLLDFRAGIIDKDLLGLRTGQDEGRREGEGAVDNTTAAPSGIEVESRRYLYLTATFDGAWRNRQPRSNWMAARLPLLLAVPLGVIGLAFSAAESRQDLTALISVLAAGAPALLAVPFKSVRPA